MSNLKLKYYTRDLMNSMAGDGVLETDYKEILLNGLEVSLPHGFTYKDKTGHERGTIRTKWWNSFSGKKYRDIVFPDADDAPDLSVETGLENDNQYPQDAPPVFIGHYWLPATKKPEPISHNIACVDYSAGKNGPLVAYRFDGERVLESGKFVAVE